MKKDVSRSRRNDSPIKVLPCLRCGKGGVTLLVPAVFERLELGDLQCKYCSAPHYLLAHSHDGIWRVVYDRDTRRYPSEYYEEFPHYRILLRGVEFDPLVESETPHEHYGPIEVYKRKRFTPAEVRQIWRQSNCRCHICGKPWKLTQRGVKGWHIDHDIPNIGGGKETEMMSNFRVACAKCNLEKGRGFTEGTVQSLLKSLLPSAAS